jgi:GR25 family glycosyltransferase involved in LPS biosynthesis
MSLSYDDFDCYVVHYTPLVERKRFLTKQFEKESITSVTFVEKFDKEQISYSDYYLNYKTFVMEYMHRNHQYYGFGGIMLKPQEISLSFKHLEAMRLFLDGEKDYMLVFEDDVILSHDFKNKFNSYVKSLPTDWGAAFIGQGAGKRIPSTQINPSVHWYKKNYPSDRCTDSILFTRDEIEKIYLSIKNDKMSYPIDHELSYVFRKLNTNVYWLEPPIVAQGSQTGLFGTFQDANSGLYIDESIKMRNDMEDLLK